MPRQIDVCGFIFAAAISASMAGAQQTTSLVSHKPGRILGVFDEASGAPIPDAEVTDLFVDGIARTEAHGLVELSRFQSRNDSVAVRIRKVGFSDTALVIMVGSADTVPVQVNLHNAGVALPTVTVNASVSTILGRRLEEFDERRKEGMGHYLLGDELAKMPDQNIADALLGRGFKCSNYSLNGVPNTSTLTISQVLRESADEFAAVEYYAHRGEVPTQFRAPCIIILWTRHS